MVRPPSVMSPSGNPQLDPKFSNQGKQGGSASQSQPSPCDSKSGGHTPKALPGPGGSMGLKNGAGNGAKGKGKRERSISTDSFDQRDPGTPNDDSDIKGMSISSLRLRGTEVFPREGPCPRRCRRAQWPSGESSCQVQASAQFEMERLCSFSC